MTLSRRRMWAIARKELREYRRNRSVVVTMAIFPLIFSVQPLVAVLTFGASVSGGLSGEHVLVYMLGIPALVPAFLAATAVAGERQQGTLEPALTTPITGEEFLLGKALAALVPSLTIAYVVYGVFIGCVLLFAKPPVATALIQGPDLIAQVLFTPLLAAWTILVGIGVSTRSSDVRVAQQLGVLASLPPVFIAALVAFDAIHPTLGLAMRLAAALVVLDILGWRIVSALFDREGLIAGGR
jgi:ABC-2 type transport system permease protein